MQERPTFIHAAPETQTLWSPITTLSQKHLHPFALLAPSHIDIEWL